MQFHAILNSYQRGKEGWVYHMGALYNEEEELDFSFCGPIFASSREERQQVGNRIPESR